MKTNGLFIIVSMLLLLVLVTAGCQFIPFRQTAEAQSLTTVDINRGTLEISITASGTITLPQITKLGFSGAVSGSQAGNAILSELNVSMGSSVTKGQVVARLDTSDQEKELLRLQNNLDVALLNLEKTKQPLYKPEEIDKAESAIVSAKANLVVAQEALKKAQNPFTENDFATAEAAVRNGRIGLDNAEQELKNTTARNDLSIQEATENLFNLQKAMETGKTVTAGQRVTEYDLQVAYNNLLLAKRQAEINLTTAQNNVAKAKDTLASAEFNLKDMLSKKQGDSLEIAQKEAAIINAQVAVVNAERTLSLMKQAPDPIDIKLKQAQVTAVQLQVDDARDQLSKSTIIAPFDGIIGDFKAKVGDAIQPGSFVIPIVDPTQVRVDAYVEEYDVNSVRLGMPVVISLDAIRGQTFNGTVEAISPLSTSQQGVVRYGVTIKIQTGGKAGNEPVAGATASAPGQRPASKGGQIPAEQSPGGKISSGISPELKDGMSTTARIIINQRDNVLLIPNKALIFQSGVQKVQVLVNGQVQDRVVKVGLANDQYTEITEGLNQGEKVVVQAATGTQQSQQRLPSMPGIMMPKP